MENLIFNIEKDPKSTLYDNWPYEIYENHINKRMLGAFTPLLLNFKVVFDIHIASFFIIYNLKQKQN